MPIMGVVDGGSNPCLQVKKVLNATLIMIKRPQAKCPPTVEMSMCGEYVYDMYVKQMPSEGMPNSLSGTETIL